jgi:hypothetical protein
MATLDAIARLGCIVCRCYFHVDTVDAPTEIHHLRTGMGMAQRSDRVIPLCPRHHRGLSPTDIAYHKNKTQFVEAYGTEEALYDATMWLMQEKDL